MIEDRINFIVMYSMVLFRENIQSSFDESIIKKMNICMKLLKEYVLKQPQSSLSKVFLDLKEIEGAMVALEYRFCMLLMEDYYSKNGIDSKGLELYNGYQQMYKKVIATLSYIEQRKSK